MRSRLSAWSAEELQPGLLVTSLLTGGLIYVLEVVFAVSFTALVYTNELANYLPLAVGFTLLGDAVLCAIVAVSSSYRGASAFEQDVPIAILTLTTAAVVAALPAGTTADTRFATVLIVIVLTTISAGVFFWLLGYFKLGGLVRFLPYPVMGGFLAGTGWLLITGALSLAVDLSWSAELLRPGLLLHWLPALIFGAVLLIVNQRARNPLIMPGLIIGSVILFYVIVWMLQVPPDQLRANGWLLAHVPAGGAWRFPLSGELLAQVEWSVILGHLGSLAPIWIISVVAMLLNVNALELIIKRDIDLNRELLVTGAGNIAAGLVGGLLGYADISFSSLNREMTGGRRLVSLVTASLLGLTVFVGATFLIYVPKMVLAGVIFYIGLSLLFEWTYRAWFKFPRIDFAIILAILAVIALRGFLEGVAVGVMAAIALFVINYSRTSVIRHALSGVDLRSRVNRSLEQRAMLDAHGQQLYILELQGFIFFGTANSLYEQVKKRILDQALPQARFVVLDFSRVTGLDSTGLLSFDKLWSLTREQGIILTFTGLNNTGVQHVSIREQLRQGGFLEQADSLRFFPDLDHGIEWCEEQIVAAARLEAEEKSLADHFAGILPEEQLHQILQYLQRQEFAPGEYLMRQEDESDDLYIVEAGQVTSQIENPGQPPLRLETMRGGRTVGEMGFYLNTPRSAAVIADEASVTYRLSRDALARMELEEPQAALAFHRLMVQLLGERATHLMRTVQALQR
jgi:SulP family sulfate permease